jgi:transposase
MTPNWPKLSSSPIALTTGKRRRTKQSKATNLIARLRDFSEAVCRFMTRPDVPFTNNCAEQAV